MGWQAFLSAKGFVMNDKRDVGQPKARKKLVLNKETVRVLTDQEQMDVEGGFKPTNGCSNGNTCACGGTCGNNLSTCAPL